MRFMCALSCADADESSPAAIVYHKSGAANGNAPPELTSRTGFFIVQYYVGTRARLPANTICLQALISTNDSDFLPLCLPSTSFQRPGSRSHRPPASQGVSLSSQASSRCPLRRQRRHSLSCRRRHQRALANLRLPWPQPSRTFCS